MKYNTIAFSMLTVGLLSSTALHAGDIEQNLPAATDAFTVDQGGVELMRVNGDGDVGIGTATPTHKLHIVGDMRLNTVDNTVYTNNIGLISSAGDMNISHSASNLIFKSDYKETMRVRRDGNVGIGTSTPDSRLTVVGLPDSATVTGNKLGGRSIHITDNGSFYVPSVAAPAGYGVIYAGGKAWLDKNLGATTVATSWDDVTPSTLGGLYQWGRAADGHQLRTAALTTVSTECSTVDIAPNAKFILTGVEPFNWRTKYASCTGDTRGTHFWSTPGASTTNGVCPTGWRVPSEQDFADLDIESAEDAYTKMKLTAAGSRNLVQGTVVNVDSYGNYWTSSVDRAYTRYLSVLSGGSYFFSAYRAYGMSVRCVKHLD